MSRFTSFLNQFEDEDPYVRESLFEEDLHLCMDLDGERDLCIDVGDGGMQDDFDMGMGMDDMSMEEPMDDMGDMDGMDDMTGDDDMHEPDDDLEMLDDESECMESLLEEFDMLSEADFGDETFGHDHFGDDEDKDDDWEDEDDDFGDDFEDEDDLEAPDEEEQEDMEDTEELMDDVQCLIDDLQDFSHELSKPGMKLAFVKEEMETPYTYDADVEPPSEKEPFKAEDEHSGSVKDPFLDIAFTPKEELDDFVAGKNFTVGEDLDEIDKLLEEMFSGDHEHDQSEGNDQVSYPVEEEGSDMEMSHEEPSDEPGEEEEEELEDHEESDEERFDDLEDRLETIEDELGIEPEGEDEFGGDHEMGEPEHHMEPEMGEPEPEEHHDLF